ncbi:endolytic transglycosylase MltG [uncultured Propionibacterium sp.]|uniref:endolytic transglycosylase MltG n=1 Tax=uncultured Propionibacterium sp. TaxID=218066 RepID=UPI0029318D43|nr:endolytic transglycosylase MltG [uncultured Propionibacterium sp.]
MKPKRAADNDLDDFFAEPGRARASRYSDEDDESHDGGASRAEGGDSGAGGLGADLLGGEASILPAGRARRSAGSWARSIIAVLLSIAVIGGGGYLGFQKASQAWTSYRGVDYDGSGDESTSVPVTIREGMTITEMGDTLAANQVVASSRAFVRIANEDGRSNGIHAGTYLMRQHMSARSALDFLVDPGNLATNLITLREGLRNSEVFAQLSQTTGIPVADFETAAGDTAALGLPDYAQGNAEGYLFPETYTYDPADTAVDVLTKMVAQFKRIAAEEDLVDKAAALGHSPHDVVVVASIIEKETTNFDYGPQIAEVFYNRLGRNVKLQSDATVIYANDMSGSLTTTDEERAVDSPYNTYVKDGLPPGAISNPGRQALHSALNPAAGDYMFFVAVNPDTGETRFADTEEEHAANVAQFQAWCQENADRCGG